MKEIIASFLIQHKECTLPGIGILKINGKPADLDIAHKQIIAPSSTVSFNTIKDGEDKKLAGYIARRSNIDLSEAENRLNSFCDVIRDEIKNSGRFDLGIAEISERALHR